MDFVKELSKLYQNDLCPMYKHCLARVERTSNIKNKAVEILKTTDEVVRKLLIFYPKTFLIGTIANVIFTVFFPNIATVIYLAIDGYFVLRNVDYLYTSIQQHIEHNKSEISSTYEEKKRLEMAVHTIITGNNFLDGIVRIFRRPV